MQRGTRPDQLRNEIEKAGKLGELAHSIREHKTADRILEKAKFIDVPAEEWNEQQNKEVSSKRADAKSTGAKGTGAKGTGAKGAASSDKPAKSSKAKK